MSQHPDIHLSPALEQLPAARRAIQSELAQLPLNPQRQQQILTATNEWLTNLMRHPLQKATDIRLRLASHPHAVYLEIDDNGSAFETIKDFSPTFEAYHQRQPTESGHGLYLVSQYLPDFNYFPKDIFDRKINRFAARLL
jgi:anti-sigma regulatory factor (Ser/Thr protein kinase)